MVGGDEGCVVKSGEGSAVCPVVVGVSSILHLSFGLFLVGLMILGSSEVRCFDLHFLLSEGSSSVEWSRFRLECSMCKGLLALTNLFVIQCLLSCRLIVGLMVTVVSGLFVMGESITVTNTLSSSLV